MGGKRTLLSAAVLMVRGRVVDCATDDIARLAERDKQQLMIVRPDKRDHPVGWITRIRILEQRQTSPDALVQIELRHGC